MGENLYIKNGITVPEHELSITATRAGGPGGQHVNKTSTRITVRWNILTTQALSAEEKSRILEKLRTQITSDGDIIVHNSSSRSQMHNKKMALNDLVQKIIKALHVPKKRRKGSVPKSAKEARLQEKKRHSNIKKMRRITESE
jgi:ribosome-associated protein